MKELDFQHDVLPLKDRIFRLALRITLDRAEAEDITQETLIRLWQKRDEWAQIESIEAYGLTICRRLALDHVRKVRFRSGQEEEIANYQLSLAQTEERDEDRMEFVKRCIDKLPEEQRSVMLLRDIEGMRYNEIAQATGLTETQVRVYLYRARTKIREEVLNSGTRKQKL